MRDSILGRDVSQRLVILVFTALLACVLVATLVGQRLSASVAGLSESLVHQAMPRIEQVASVRDATLEVQFAVTELVHGAERASARAALDHRLATLQQVVRASAVGATLPGEAALTNDVYRALNRFETAVARIRAAVERADGSARRLFYEEVLPAANSLGDHAIREIELNAQRGQELAAEIRATRGRIIWLSYGLVATCVVVATAGLAALRRSSERRIARLGDYARDQESKAEERELFAGRVAHDIRGPLATASLAAETLEVLVDRQDAQSVVARLRRSLTRAAAICDGLLAFARAGARPEPGARANVREVVDDMVDALGPELARSEIDLAVEPVPPMLVACSTGVLASLLGNLLRNAIKYMGTDKPRRIAIRCVERGAAMRFEIADTGPGIAPAMIPRLFEPYFRAVTTNQSGLGLGLSTVRKLVDRHGGRAGVQSVQGEGSTFWFELPCAGIADATARDSGQIEPLPSPLRA